MAVVETERRGQILVVRMNRPERLNARATSWNLVRPSPRSARFSSRDGMIRRTAAACQNSTGWHSNASRPKS
jgi:hypothetical protein